MPWSVKPYPELGLIETVYSGRITDDDIKASTMKAIAVSNESGIGKFLSDLTDVETHDLSTLKLYEQPEHWKGLRAKGKNRLALIVPDSKEIINAAAFYETVSRNRGWNVQIFSERQEAIDWLLS